MINQLIKKWEREAKNYSPIDSTKYLLCLRFLDDLRKIKRELKREK